MQLQMKCMVLFLILFYPPAPPIYANTTNVLMKCQSTRGAEKESISQGLCEVSKVREGSLTY